MKRVMFLIIAGLFLAGFSVVLFAAQGQEESAVTNPAAKQIQQIKPREVRVDRNHDGKVDHVEIYDAKGAIVRVENDTKGDGKINEWIYYENGIPVKAEKDLTGSGKPNMTLFYDSKGQVTKSEADTNGDGKIDEWVYYENGKPIKAEKDTKGDGKPDTWINY
jgi:hypothetical protein